MMGPFVLILSALYLWAVEPFAAPISIIGMVLAFISAFLLAMAWKDMVARDRARRAGLHPSMAAYHHPAPSAPVYGGARPPSSP
jgi:hypothetical protein